MKRILPRFFRCLLIAALVAAIAGPLAPTGTAIGDSIPCDDPPYFADEGSVEPTTTLRAVISSPFTSGITVWGTRFPAGTALSVLNVGSWNGLPSPPPVTDAAGSFVVWLTVPSGSDFDSRPLVSVTVADVERSAPLILPCPEITLSTESARPGDTITITGTAFDAFANVQTINIGQTSVTPTPNSLTDGAGDFGASVVVPALHPGAYTVTVRTGPAFAATAPITILGPEVTVSPTVGLTGSVITITGTGFPARTALSEINFGGGNALPVPAPATDVYGNFTITMTVPPSCRGDSCVGHGPPVLVCVSVADVVGCTDFTIPNPFISLSTDKARPGDTITITGTAFNSYGNVDTISFGVVPAPPAPNPRAAGVGDFTANVTVPPLNPGAYTVTVRTDPAFTATATISILGKDPKPPEEAFQALTSRGLLTLAAAAPPGGTGFGAYVPGLPGDTLTLVEPGGVLVLTLAKDARISVGGQPAVDVAADTPTFFPLGADVSVEVVES